MSIIRIMHLNPLKSIKSIKKKNNFYLKYFIFYNNNIT